MFGNCIKLIKTGDGLRYNRNWQLPSYVEKIPTGKEKGVFLAVDLGGTNCRICAVELHGDSTYTVTQSKHAVPANLRINSCYKPLFAFIAARIADFLVPKVEECENEKARSRQSQNTYRMGFTFSFAFEQRSIASGRLLRWDKGWDIPNAIGKDPCSMLQEAIDELGLPVLVAALANDSVGTLVTRSYTASASGTMFAGIILGTGTNAAYVEKRSNIRRLHNVDGPSDVARGKIMVINTEWGSFDDVAQMLRRTKYDDELDSESPDPGIQRFEKQVSGMYLGEILRRVLLQLHGADNLDMTLSRESPLFQQGKLGTSFMSRLAEVTNHTAVDYTEIVADALLASNVSFHDTTIIRLVAAAIANRAARLTAASLAALILHSDRLQVGWISYSPYDILMNALRWFQRTTESIWLSRISTSLARFARVLLKSLDLSRFVLSCLVPLSLPENTSLSRSREFIDIAVDGSLFELYPDFAAAMRAALSEVSGIGNEGAQRIRMELAKDGSGVGAALLAQTTIIK